MRPRRSSRRLPWLRPESWLFATGLRGVFLGLDRSEGQAVMTASPAGQKSERLDSAFSDAHLVTFAHARLIALIEGGVLPVVVADGNLPTCLLR